MIGIKIDAQLIIINHKTMIISGTGSRYKCNATKFRRIRCHSNGCNAAEWSKAFSKKTEYKDAVELESGKIEVLRDEAPEPNFVPTFMAAPAFAGSRQGYVYKQGPAGLGYYRDDKNDDVAQTELQPAASSPNLEFAPAKTPEEEEGVTAYVAAAMKMQAEMECEPEGVATFGDGGIDDLD